MRNWLLGILGGPVGFVVKGVIAAIVGAVVGIVYDKAWAEIYHIPWLLTLANHVMAMMNPDVLKALTPTAIGTAAGSSAWILLQGWFTAHLQEGNKAIQQTLNANPAAPDVREDGIITKDGETAKAVQIISRAAYEAVYPDDTGNRGKDGMPEIRKPLP